MAGPVSGNKKTKLIGSGYKTNYMTLYHKWGVYKTEAIVKQDIIDYVYEEQSYLNMIEGSEELKAYWFESTNFPKVDTTMIEQQNYYAYYSESSVLQGNFNTTYGGPMYVEVGRNKNIPL